jgi:hypothetical protein
MPRFDIRKDDERLKPLAPFQVLAVMCCPTDRIKRERVIGDIEVTSGLAVPRHRPFSSEEFRKEVRLSSLKAVVAGGLLLTRLQLHLNGNRFSLARAMPLVTALLPAWEAPVRRNLATRCKYPTMAPQPAQNACRLRGV